MLERRGEKSPGNIFNIFIYSWLASTPTIKLVRKQDLFCEAADSKKNKHLLLHRPAAADQMSSKKKTRYSKCKCKSYLAGSDEKA